MSQKYEVDKTGDIKKLFKKVIKKEFPELDCLNFLYVWRSKEKMEDGLVVMAEVFKLSNRDRDLFDFDVRVEIDETVWPQLTKKNIIKLVWHELKHIELEREEQDEESGELSEGEIPVKVDSEGRIKFWIKDHDLVIKRFEGELEKFGLDEDEKYVRSFLNKVNKKFKK